MLHTVSPHILIGSPDQVSWFIVSDIVIVHDYFVRMQALQFNQAQNYRQMYVCLGQPKLSEP